MVFFAACFFFGYLIQRYVNGKKSYLLAPVGAFLSSISAILVGAFIIAPLLNSEIDAVQIVLTALIQTFWGTFLVAFAIWFYRRKKEKAPEEEKKADQVF